MIYTYNPSTWVAEAGEWQVEGRSAWVTESLSQIEREAKGAIRGLTLK